MKFRILILFIFSIKSLIGFANTRICSWNLHDFGKTKNDSEIDFIANTLKKFDIIAIQEVVAGEGGANAVARLANALNRKGFKWDYTVSNPTSSSAYKTERYAFIWRTGTVLLKGNAWLEKRFSLEMDREPFLANFVVNKSTFTLVNFHAITKSKQPETEIKYLKYFKDEYPELNLIFIGDFNCPQSHSVFTPIKKMGYKPILIGQKTSLKRKCTNGDCLASEFDNIFYNSNKILYINSGIIMFFKTFANFEDALTISDHVPVWFEFSII
jgi:deoxyribonuclease-1-like protein